MDARVSIAVPSLDYARYIGACLESIRTQDFARFEVLIADGGSQDQSLEIIKEFCTRDPRFRLVSRSDSGQADAVQQALAYASGEILCFLNADDCYMSRSVLSRVTRVFEECPDIDVLTMQGYFIDDEGRKLRKVRYRYHPLDSIKLMKRRTAVLQPATFWRRHVWEDIGFRRDFHFAFDVVFFYEAYLRYGWLELPDVAAGYRWHGENKSAQISGVRIAELAAFERLKYGSDSWRGDYLDAIVRVVNFLDSMRVGQIVKRGLRVVVNGSAYLTVYRLPGI
jgi:glycosyltransferase involved in cell wall biosynthesis